MSALTEVTNTTFNDLILNAPGAAILEVGAPSCGPCRELVRVLEALSTEVGPAVRIASTNAYTEVDLAARLGVRGLPTLIVFRDGVELERHCGYGGARPIQTLVRDLAQSPAPS